MRLEWFPPTPPGLRPPHSHLRCSNSCRSGSRSPPPGGAVRGDIPSKSVPRSPNEPDYWTSLSLAALIPVHWTVVDSHLWCSNSACPSGTHRLSPLGEGLQGRTTFRRNGVRPPSGGEGVSPSPGPTVKPLGLLEFRLHGLNSVSTGLIFRHYPAERPYPEVGAIISGKNRGWGPPPRGYPVGPAGDGSGSLSSYITVEAFAGSRVRIQSLNSTW